MKYSPIALALLATLASTPFAHAEDVKTSPDGEKVEKISVVGNRFSSRTTTETPVPVDLFGVEDLQNTGQTETSRMLQFVAPSFNFSTSTVSDGTDILRPATLRGLGPDQTLVLINGKRRHNTALVHVNGSIGRGTAGVDLNAIPASAIKRIEVLRDGAAAQYGSDAIAGVINIVLKDETDYTAISAHAGSTYEGDGDTVNVSVNSGIEIGDSGFINVSAEVRDRGDTNRAGLDPRQQYALVDGQPDPREATFDRLNHRYGDADSKNVYVFANGEYAVSDTAQVYFYGGLSNREGESGGFYRRSLDNRNIPDIYPDGFLPLINTEVDDMSLAAGLRGSMGDWDYDFSVVHGENKFNFFISNSLNVSYGPTSPTEADAGTLKFKQTTVNFDAMSTFDWGLDYDVNFAAGVEYRRDNYEIQAGDQVSWDNGGFPNQSGGVGAPGIQVFPGFRPANEVDQSRHNVALYSELGFQFTDNLFTNVALRYEDYSDFGDNLSWKIALNYNVSDELTLRGSINTGFRAPSLHQQYFNNTSTQFVDVNGELTPVEVGTYSNNSDVAQALGVAQLTDETSFNVGGGIVYTPIDGLTITADIYQINIEDRIVISGRFSADSSQTVADLLAPFPGVRAAQFFSNAIDTETKGIDLVVDYAIPLENGDTLSLTGSLNLTSTELDGAVRVPEAMQDDPALASTLFSRQEQIWLEDGQPSDQLALSATYSTDQWDFNVRLNRFGEVTSTESASDPLRDQTFSAEWLTDVSGKYRFSDELSVTVGVNNLFDVTPEENIDSNSFNGIFPYNRRVAPFGFNGGYYYVRADYRF